MSDSNKLILQRALYLNNINKSLTANQISDTLLNEKTQKKMFFPNIFMNSEEFKDMGTLHFERRNTDYYPEGNERKGQFNNTNSDFYQLTAGIAPIKKWKQKYNLTRYNIYFDIVLEKNLLKNMLLRTKKLANHSLKKLWKNKIAKVLLESVYNKKIGDFYSFKSSQERTLICPNLSTKQRGLVALPL